MAKVIVTGTAGFIGMHVAARLLERRDEVVGVDNLNSYYDPELKSARLRILESHPTFSFQRGDLADRAWTSAFFAATRADSVVHLAAQAGVRYSIENPSAYVDSNLVGFANVLEGCRQTPVAHLVYASSSSVYGANTKVPFAVGDPVDHPVSLYAATKKANELMAHVYAHLYGIPVTGLRFFTVYGPWGRPDMAYYGFTASILAGRPIPVFNHGRLSRDFTYIDDIVEGAIRVLDRPPTGIVPPARVFNLGNSAPVPLLEFIRTLEAAIGADAVLDMRPMQPGDVLATYADIADLERDVGFRPTTSLKVGLERFVAWFRDYHRVDTRA
jgi:UDP-glucuronate 4-epimerase